MRTKILIPTILIIAAVALSACSASVQLGQTQPRTISVNGNAQVILAPDIAYVSIGVHSEAKTATEAVASNNTQTQAVIDAIKAQGVDAKDIQTTNFSVYQQEKFAPTGESLGTFFMADNTVYVTIHDITKIGDILDAAISAGANNIYGITFDVQNKEAALATGRDQAMADAQAQAEQLAKAAGATLGDVQINQLLQQLTQPDLLRQQSRSSCRGWWWRQCAHINRSAHPDRIGKRGLRPEIRLYPSTERAEGSLITNSTIIPLVREVFIFRPPRRAGMILHGSCWQ